MKRLFVVFACACLLSACSDAGRAQWGSLGLPGHITCYSGGQIIYDGYSTGKIMTEQGSDGWFFNDKATNSLVRVSGDCVIRN